MRMKKLLPWLVAGMLLLTACHPASPASKTPAPQTTTGTAAGTTTGTEPDTTIGTDPGTATDTAPESDSRPTAGTEPSDSEPPDTTAPVTRPTGPAGPAEEIRPKGNTAILMNPMTGGADAKGEALRQEILGARDELKIKGKTYYISPTGDDFNTGTSPQEAWQTLDSLLLNGYLFEEGDAVLLERGGIYRMDSPIQVKSGLTYGAYGSGEKPAIYGSSQNYAQEGLWTPSNKKYVWKLSLPLEDAGIVVFNHGEAVGDKKDGLLQVKKNGDFYHNTTDSVLYLYLDSGLPNVVYKDIEIGVHKPIFNILDGIRDVVIDNICMKYTGTFGVRATGDNSHITVTNCEIGWIGGSLQSPGIRYGNGIQFYDAASDIVVRNCWIYQSYDAGLTFQGMPKNNYERIWFENNLLEYNSYNFEFFTDGLRGQEYVKAEQMHMHDIYLQNNIMRFAGYGWGSQRPDPTSEAHITGWQKCYEGMKNFNIKNNIFDVSTRNAVIWYWSDNYPAVQVGLNVSGNSFYEKAGPTDAAIYFSNAGAKTATNQKELEEAVAVFDASPREVRWLGR